MKHTVTNILLMTLFISFGVIGQLWAQEEADPITVTFVINTSTVADTLFPEDVVQMRGVINDDDSGPLNWGSTSAQATNVGGDFWELDLELNPGDEVQYKVWVGSTTEDGLGFDGGWETGDNYIYEVPAEATEDIRTDVIYYARPDIGREAPYSAGESEENEVAVHFRVNVGGQVELGTFDPDNENQIVGVRGQINNESGLVEYKFVIDSGEDGVAWEDGDNKSFNTPAADSTLHWKFFNNQRPPEGDIVDATLQFAVNVGLLENLGYFNRAIDEVKIRGTFNNWSEGEMSYVEALDVWSASVNVTQEVGSDIMYKYFIKWDDSRFDETSENYIAGLDAGNGWEEPGTTGGSNRVYTFTSDEVQEVPGDFDTETAFFNSYPEQAVIRSEDVVDGDGEFLVTFNVDMTDALTHDEPFDPANDELFLLMEEPIFAVSQGVPTGSAALDDPAHRELLQFEPTGSDNMYTLTLDLQLPTVNSIGLVLLYEKENGTIVENGGGFDAGRRYYRYITPAAVDGDDVFWSSDNTLNDIVWKAEDLDFEEPPSYGIGDDNGAAKITSNDENGKVTSLDWGETLLVLSAEPRLDEDNRNYFYSGTLYIQDEAVSINDENGGLVRQFSLNQNYPNPFNPSTTISFTLPNTADVSLEVYNMLGQRVATLLNNQTLSSGSHMVTFDASSHASGIYFYRIQAGNFTHQRSMTLIK